MASSCNALQLPLFLVKNKGVCVYGCVCVSGRRVGLHVEENMITAAATTVTSHVTDDDDVTTVTSSVSVKPDLLVDNETVTYSTSVNITGLEHFAQHLVKVGVNMTAVRARQCSTVCSVMSSSIS